MDRVRFCRPEEWRSWLHNNHGRSGGAWLATFRKGRGPYLAPADANTIALHYGWYHAHRTPSEGDLIQHLYRPRRRFIPWSEKDRAETTKQIDAGLIHPAGLRVARMAQADGSWDIGDRARLGRVPLDLLESLDHAPETRGRFDLLDPRVKNQLLKQLTIDSRWHPERRVDLIGQVLKTVDQLDPAEPWWAPPPPAEHGHVDLDISKRILSRFKRVHQTAGRFALIGPSGLSKTWSASQFVRLNPNSTAIVRTSGGAAASWTEMQRELTRAARGLGATRPHVSERLAGVDLGFALASAVADARSLKGGTLRGHGIVADGVTFIIDDAQSLSKTVLARLLLPDAAIASEPVGLILIGTPELTERLDAVEGSAGSSTIQVERQTLAADDLTSEDMQRALAAWGIAGLSDQDAVLEKLRMTGTRSLRALKRLAG